MGLCHSCFSSSAPEQNDPVPVLGGLINNGVRMFTFRELLIATKHFRPDYFLGEGGFGKVYRGHLGRLNQDVAVKQLDLQSSLQGHEEFLSEVMALSLADHPNLVKLIGYCIEGNQHLIVYEYMPLRSLDYHLHDLEPNREALDWNTRMRIAADAIQGLEYLHTTMNPKLIHRDLKSSNVLLGENYHAKLSDFGLVKIAPSGDKTHVSTRVMGTVGYCAPEYASTGHLTTRSDIYSFGVILLEILTGRQAIDSSKPSSEKYLVEWATLMVKHRTNFPKMVDPLLKGRFPRSDFVRALCIAAICIQEDPALRPEIGILVQALVFLASQPYPPPPSTSSSSTAHIDQPSTSSSSTAHIDQPSTSNSSTAQIYQPGTNRSSTAQIDQPSTSSSSTAHIDQPSTSNSSTAQIYQPSTNRSSTAQIDQPSTNRSSTAQIDQPNTSSSSTAQIDQPSTSGSSTA